MSKVIKAIIIVICVFVLIAGAFLVAAPLTYDVINKRAFVVIPGICNSALLDTDTDRVVFDPLDTDIHDYCYDDIMGDDMIQMVVNIIAETDIIQQLNDVLDRKEGNFLDKWAINDDGTSLPNIVHVDWSRDGYTKYGALEASRVPYDYFKDNYEFKKNTDLFVFQYDWRLDIDLAATELIETCEEYDEVVIAAHSMGNVVTARALAKSADFRKKVILNLAYAAPYYGSYSALDILENGRATIDPLLDMANDTVNKNTVLKSIFGSMLTKTESLCYDVILPMFQKYPGIVQLLPSINLVCPDGKNSTLIVNGLPIKTSEQLLAYYQSCDWAYNDDGSMRAWVRDLDDYWNSFYVDGTFATELVNTYYFAGDEVDTLTGFKVSGASSSKTFERTYTQKGDGTVPYVCASLNELNMSKTYVFKGLGHVDMGHGFDIGLDEPTKEAYSSIDNPYKVLLIKIKY